jgi:hypothetical protein
MSWPRRPKIFPDLNDGRMLATLAQARELRLDMSQLDKAVPQGMSDCEPITRAVQMDGLI